MLVTLAFSFTGYLLPWDQLALLGGDGRHNLVHYVPVVGGKLQDLLIGGDQIGQSTLLRFYALHVAVLPIALVLLLAVHIWRVRKDGFAVERSNVGAFAEEATDTAAPAPPWPRWPSAAPELYGGRVRLLGVVDRESVTAEERPVDDTVFTWPHLLGAPRRGRPRRVRASCSASAWRSPRRCAASPTRTSLPSRRRRRGTSSGLQELLSHFDPLVAGILVPGRRGPRVRAAAVHRPQPRHEARHRKVAIVLFSVLLAIAVVLTVIGMFFRGPGLGVHRAVDPLVRRAVGGDDERHDDATSCAPAGSSAVRC